MVDRYYVVTDATGRARNGEIERHFELREGAGPDDGGPVALVNVTTLLSCLDEVIFEAEPIGSTSEVEPGTWHADDARLVHRTPWDCSAAASFALSCVEHVIGEDRSVEIPGGQTLGAVLDDAKRFLEESGGEGEGRLAKLSRLATARRLHRSGEHIGDLARGRLGEDLADEIAITSDAGMDAARLDRRCGPGGGRGAPARRPPELRHRPGGVRRRARYERRGRPTCRGSTRPRGEISRSGPNTSRRTCRPPCSPGRPPFALARPSPIAPVRPREMPRPRGRYRCSPRSSRLASSSLSSWHGE